MIELEVVFGGETQSSRVFSPQQMPIKIGRASDSDIRIDNALVSRRHALIGMLGTKIVIADQDSDNGFTLKDRGECRIGALEDGDVIGLGKYEIRVGIKKVERLTDDQKRFKPLAAGDRLEATIKMERFKGAAGDSPSTQHKLQLIKPSNRLLPLLSWHTWIGSSDTCDIVVRGFGIAPKHLLLYWDGEQHHASDLTGKRKVKVNGEKVDDVVLGTGDKVTVGALQFEYR